MPLLTILYNDWVVALFTDPFHTTLATCAVIYSSCVIINTISSDLRLWGA
jgi:hypothetical protein